MSASNMLHLPKRLVVRILEDGAGDPVSNIAVTLIIHPQSKTDYHLGPPLSGSDGRIIMEQPWVDNAINYERNSFIMDYSSTMQQCSSDIHVAVMSANDIERAKSAMKLYGIENGGDSVNHGIADLDNAKNKHYRPRTMPIKLDDPNEESREVIIQMAPAKR
ncbi:MAG TPA: hypothetical protein VGJ22_13915 [Anaerolineales bacterium]